VSKFNAAQEDTKPGHDYKVGDHVHYSFNGDSYPGAVVAVSKTKILVELWTQRGPGIFVRSRNREPRLFTLRSDGEFRSAGHGTWILGKGMEQHLSREF
jgi:hypothetical protein